MTVIRRLVLTVWRSLRDVQLALGTASLLMLCYPAASVLSVPRISRARPAVRLWDVCLSQPLKELPLGVASLVMVCYSAAAALSVPRIQRCRPDQSESHARVPSPSRS